jgi:hypothetical protein
MIWSLLFVAGVGTAATNAPNLPPPLPPAHDRWYGGPAVATDVISLGVALGATRGHAYPLAFAALGGYLLGAPINHFSNGHGGRAAASLTFRALAVGLTIEAAARLAHCPAEETSVCNPIGSQLVVGILAIPFIAIFDDALARDKVQQPPPAGVSFAPGFFATREGVFGSLAGTFCGL